MVLEKTLENPLDCKEIQSVHPEGNRYWIFIGRTDVEAETPILWPPDAKSWLIWKDHDVGKDWRQEEKGMIDEMVGWHHWLNGHEFGWTPGVGGGQRSLACCGSWGHRVGHDWATELNWTKSHSPGSKVCWDCQSCWASGLCRPLGPFQVSWCAGEMKAELWWRRSSSVKLLWLSKLALMSHVYLEWLWGCWSYRDETRHFSQPLTLSLTMITPQAWNERCQRFLLTWPQDPTLQYGRAVSLMTMMAE